MTDRRGVLTLACVLFAIPAGGHQDDALQRLARARTASGTYQNAARGFAVRVPSLSGPVRAFEEYVPDNPTASVFFLDDNAWLLGVIYTRIRPEYPQDFRLIESRIKPRYENQQSAWGAADYQVRTEQIGATPVLTTVNAKPGFAGERDLQYLRHTLGDFDPGNQCQCVRSDFHFVRSGYYVQLIAIVNAKTGLSKDAALARSRAQLLAAFERLEVGG
jgi:hypothetical protein